MGYSKPAGPRREEDVSSPCFIAVHAVLYESPGQRGSSWIVLDERGEPKARGGAVAATGKR